MDQGLFGRRGTSQRARRRRRDERGGRVGQLGAEIVKELFGFLERGARFGEIAVGFREDEALRRRSLLSPFGADCTLEQQGHIRLLLDVHRVARGTVAFRGTYNGHDVGVDIHVDFIVIVHAVLVQVENPRTIGGISLAEQLLFGIGERGYWFVLDLLQEAPDEQPVAQRRLDRPLTLTDGRSLQLERKQARSVDLLLSCFV